MSDLNHSLYHDFPHYQERINRLKLEHDEFARLALGCLGERADEGKRAVEEADGLGAGMELQRHIRRALVPRDGPIGQPGAVVVRGELPAHRPRVVGMRPLQGARDALVELPTAHGAQRQIGDLADQVGVPVLVDRLSRLADGQGERFRPAGLLREMVRGERRFYPEA